ncbi:MAG: energy transducer TonB [Usitatibacter sp.]
MKPKSAPPRALEKPRQPGRIRAVFLAVLVHAAFFALIVFGVAWQSRPDVPVVAELWDKLPPATKAVAPKPEPKAEPEPPKPEPLKPEPQPEPPKPEPVKPPPKPPEEKPEPPKPDPAIAKKLEREKKEKEKKEKLERDKREKQKEDEAKKKREKEEASKQKREEESRRREDERLKQEAERERAAAVSARNAEIQSWIDKIKASIRGHANVPDTVTGQPEVQVRIRLLPGGEVLDMAIIKRSGNPTYDAAIERGIRSASPLPVPAANSELFPQFRDLNLNIKHER